MPFNRPIPESKLPRKASSGLGAYVEAEKLMQIAIVLPSAVFIGWLAGAWLDNRLHHSWITLVGIILGSIAGLTAAVRMALAAVADPKTEKKNEGGIGAGSPGKHS
jgi:F0F1-type ATP synthase assembly protein I